MSAGMFKARTNARINRRQALRAAFLGVVVPALPALPGLLAGCDGKSWNPLQAAPDAIKFNGIDITGAPYARTLSLPDTQGKVRTLAEFQGKVVVVFFGFTQCPDVCPTTMAELAEIRRRLGPQGDKLQGVFVSIDPERDTNQVLGDYVKALDPSFVALRGSLDQVTAAAQEFKVFFQKVPLKGASGYTMDHTAGSFVFDPQGQIRLFVRYGLGVDKLTADIKQLLVAKPAKS